MSLEERLRARIRAEGPMRVRDFMEAALYDPAEGYYARGPAIGTEGDFYTASNVSLFPHALARFVKAATERLGGARVVELGGGRGDLADALGAGVTVVEPSVGLANAQEARGLQVVPSLAALKPAPTVFVANEVLDALPVHRLVMTPQGVCECYLDAELREVDGPLSDPRLEAAAARLALEEGARAEVSLAAADLMAAMAAAAPRAIALFLDYGEHGPLARDTLRGFHEHRATGPYERPGQQDVTADVDFGFVAQLAREGGWDVHGERAQGELLADLGLLDDMMAAMARGDTDAYLAGKNLLLPGGMGERFRALCLTRGAPATPPLPGFRKDTFPGASRR